MITFKDIEELPQWDELRWELIQEALRRSNGSVIEAGRLIGLSYKTLYRVIAESEGRHLNERRPEPTVRGPRGTGIRKENCLRGHPLVFSPTKSYPNRRHCPVCDSEKNKRRYQSRAK